MGSYLSSNYKNTEFNNAIDEFINATEEAINLLRNLLEKIAKHQNAVNSVKTVGTVSTVTGTALVIGSIIAAPFTGGSSVILAGGVGSALATAGAVTNIGTDVIDYLRSKDFQNEVNSICEKRKAAAAKLQEHFDKIQTLANELINDDLGLNEEESLLAAFMAIKKGISGLNKVREYVRTIQTANESNNFRSFGLRNGGFLWKGMRVKSAEIVSSLGKLGVNVSKRTAFNLFKAGNVVLRAAFVIMDVRTLINNWGSKHPTAQAVEYIIRKLEEELEPLRKMKDELENVD